MTYSRTYDRLNVSSLTRGDHEKTCGYWFTVRDGATSHTAFTTRAELDHWLAERGLILVNDLPAPGTRGYSEIAGAYRTVSHGTRVSDDLADGMDPGAFYALLPVLMTAVMSNAEYTLALVTEEDGMRVVNYLNPNVRGRVVFDRAAGRFMTGYRKENDPSAFAYTSLTQVKS